MRKEWQWVDPLSDIHTFRANKGRLFSWYTHFQGPLGSSLFLIYTLSGPIRVVSFSDMLSFRAHSVAERVELFLKPKAFWLWIYLLFLFLINFLNQIWNTAKNKIIENKNEFAWEWFMLYAWIHVFMHAGTHVCMHSCM